MEDEDGPLRLHIHLAFKYAASHVDCQQQQQEFKPFGIVNSGFSSKGAKIILDECGNGYGNGKQD